MVWTDITTQSLLTTKRMNSNKRYWNFFSWNSLPWYCWKCAIIEMILRCFQACWLRWKDVSVGYTGTLEWSSLSKIRIRNRGVFPSMSRHWLKVQMLRTGAVLGFLSPNSHSLVFFVVVVLQMLLNLHKKTWMDGLTLQDYDDHCALNQKTVKVSLISNMLHFTKSLQRVKA